MCGRGFNYQIAHLTLAAAAEATNSMRHDPPESAVTLLRALEPRYSCYAALQMALRSGSLPYRWRWGGLPAGCFGCPGSRGDCGCWARTRCPGSAAESQARSLKRCRSVYIQRDSVVGTSVGMDVIYNLRSVQGGGGGTSTAEKDPCLPEQAVEVGCRHGVYGIANKGVGKL